ncbi:Rrf2 family transcriptional regulator [Pseudomonas synxantha]|nr:Rrf2 family transcriptional regulator [Pseudomonas synxantha]
MGGGMQLAKKPGKISLIDVYRAVEDPEIFALHRGKPDQKCLVGKNIQRVLSPRFDKAQQALEDELATVTLEDIVNDINRFKPASLDAVREPGL